MQLLYLDSLGSEMEEMNYKYVSLLSHSIYLNSCADTEDFQPQALKANPCIFSCPYMYALPIANIIRI